MERAIVLGAVVAALGFAGRAGAASNYKVFLGEQTRPPAGTPKGATLDMFLPGKVTINAGDSITFSSATFHTVAYGPKPPPLFMPDPAKGKYAGINDAAGKPFYFDGLAKLDLQRPGVRARSARRRSRRGAGDAAASSRRTGRRRRRRRSRSRSRRPGRTTSSARFIRA